MNRTAALGVGAALLAICLLSVEELIEAHANQNVQAGRAKGSARKSKRKANQASARKSTKGASTKPIDVKVQRFQESFVRQAADLAKQYEEAGNLVKTRQMLELILKLSPEVKGVREKIKQLDEEMLSANELEVDVDVSRGWGKPVAAVFKGQAFRILSAGDYRFIASLQVGPSGFSVADTARDMADGIRCGALIGVVVPAPEAGKKTKPGKPFLVGNGGTITPRDTGLLFLKVNAPGGHKSNGRLKVRMTGNVRKP